MSDRPRTREELDAWTKPHFVYWCQDPGEMNKLTEGYAGITDDLIRREGQHRSPGGKLTYPESKFHEIGRGTLKQCRQMEYLMRPTARIGRNINPGGAWSGFIRLTPEEKAKASRKRLETLANRTHEEKAEISRKLSETLANKTPEEKAEFGKKISSSRLKQIKVRQERAIRITDGQRHLNICIAQVARTPDEKHMRNRRIRAATQSLAALRGKNTLRRNRIQRNKKKRTANNPAVYFGSNS